MNEVIQQVEHSEPDDDPLYPTRKVAAMFHLSTETVRTWIKIGKIKGVLVGPRWHIPRSEVIRVANERHGDGGL